MKTHNKWVIVLLIIVGAINIWHFGGDLLHGQVNNDAKTTQTTKKANQKKPFNAKPTSKKKATNEDASETDTTDDQDKVIDNVEQNHAEDQTHSSESNWDLTQANATEFGIEDVQTVQSNVGSIYSSKYLPDQGMSYTWENRFGTFIRVDDENNHITSVYLHDQNDPASLGDVLYQGQTNYQKDPQNANY